MRALKSLTQLLSSLQSSSSSVKPPAPTTHQDDTLSVESFGLRGQLDQALDRESGLMLELKQLKARLAQLESSSSSSVVPVSRPTTGKSLSKIELERRLEMMTRELSQLDKVIVELQDNNKSLLDRNKGLEKELKEIRQSVRDSLTRESLQIDGNRTTMKNTESNSNSNRDKEITQLREQVSRAEHFNSEELQAVRLQVDRLKKENHDLTDKMTSELRHQQQMASNAGSATQQEIHLLKDSHKRAVDELSNRLKWYIENQEAVDEKTKMMEMAKRDNDVLRQQIANMSLKRTESVPSPSVKSLTLRHAEDAKAMKELQERIVGLEREIRDKNPNSTMNLIRAVRPDLSIELRERGLKEKLKQLDKEMSDMRLGYEDRLIGLRNEHERISAEKDNAIKLLTQQQQEEEASVAIEPSSLPDPPSNISSIRQLKMMKERLMDAEKHVDKIRSFYTKKLDDEKRIKDGLVRQLKQLSPGSIALMETNKAEIVQADDDNNTNNSWSTKCGELSSQVISLSSQIGSMLSIVQQKDEMIQKLNQRENISGGKDYSDQLRLENDQLRQQVSQLVTLTAASPKTIAQSLSSKIVNLETRLAQRETDLERYINTARDLARLEIARLRTIHQEEVRHKDEVISKFRDKLRHLVDELQEMKNKQNL